MSQIILKDRTAHLASYTFFTRDVYQYKTRHFHNSINHHKHVFHKMLIISYFCHVNIAKFLTTALLQNTSRSSHLQMLFKEGVLKSFADFTGKQCWSLFLKNFVKERLQHRCFPVKFTKLLRTSFLQNTSGGCLCMFLEITIAIKQLFCNLAVTYQLFFLLDTSFDVQKVDLVCL